MRLAKIDRWEFFIQASFAGLAALTIKKGPRRALKCVIQGITYRKSESTVPGA